METVNQKKNLTVVYALLQGSFWCSMCVVSTYAAVYLGSFGYSNTQLGIVVALGAIVGFLLPMVVSPAIDKSKTINASMAMILFQTIGICLGIASFFLPEKGIVKSVVYICWLGVMLLCCSMLVQISIDYIYEGFKIGFGVARAFGSLAFVGLSSWLGILLVTMPEKYMPLIGIGLELAVILFVWLLFKTSGREKMTKSVSVKKEEAASVSLSEFLKGNRDFCLLLCGIALIFGASEFFGVYMINIVEGVGGNSADMGGILAVAAALEIPSMVLWGKISKRFDPDLLLAGSLFCFALRELVFGLSTSLLPFYLASVFQMLGYGIYTPAIVDYTKRNIPYKDSTKAQSLAVAMNTFGLVFASLVGGILVDGIGVSPTLLLFTGISFAGASLGTFAIRRHRKSGNV